MAISDWPSRWNALRRACVYRLATGRWAEGMSQPPRFDVGPPASEDEVVGIEEQLGCAIPDSLRKVFLEYSAQVRIEWALPDEIAIPERFRQLWSGECRWDLKSLPDLMQTYGKWLAVFSDPDDYWDGPWQNKFPVLEVGNGDMLAIDLGEQQPVLYLSHEGDNTAHGYWLGRDFEDYVDRLSLLGCVGAEDWQIEPFLTGPRACLETNGENAQRWREWFGLSFADGC